VAEDAAAIADEYVPAAQKLHIDDPDSLYIPA
jgi:hypothetical protein